jgi:hypothetical protein
MKDNFFQFSKICNRGILSSSVELFSFKICNKGINTLSTEKCMENAVWYYEFEVFTQLVFVVLWQL